MAGFADVDCSAAHGYLFSRLHGGLVWRGRERGFDDEGGVSGLREARERRDIMNGIVGFFVCVWEMG